METANQELLKQLNLDIELAQKVEQVLKTKGWKEIIEPILDKMIEDVIGCKKDGRWEEGAFLHKNLRHVKADRLLWYRQALIDFHQRVMQIVDQGKNAREQKKSLNEPQKYTDGWRGYSSDVSDEGVSG